MAQLRLKSITCIKKQELVNKDTIAIKLDGVQVWSGTGFKKNVTRSLETVDPHKFTNQVKLEVEEVDRGRNDFIGEKVIQNKPRNFGVREVSFAPKPGIDYRMTYEVR